MDRSSIVILSASFAIFAGVVILSWPDLAMALALENSPFAWLQSSLLVSCATAAGARSMLSGGTRGKWFLFSILLLLAALDERFMGHEHVQEFLLNDVFDGAEAWKLRVQWIILIYGVIGLVVLRWLSREMNVPGWKWARAGLLVGCVALGLDAAFDSVAIQIIEELLEAVSEAFLLCGLFIELRSERCLPS